MRFGTLLITSLLLAATACSKAPEKEMETTFESAPPEQKKIAQVAMEAFEKQDYPKAVVNLQILRSEPAMSPDQITAVQDMMAQIQSSLAARAEAGDAKARETLRMLQAMPRR